MECADSRRGFNPGKRSQKGTLHDCKVVELEEIDFLLLSNLFIFLFGISLENETEGAILFKRITRRRQFD